MSSTVLDQIRELLRASSIAFREVEHAPTFTSEESAKARGEPLSVGAKALVLKVDAGFVVCVLPADRKLDSSSLKQHMGIKKFRFATADELMELTGLVPGCVPPFGHPILPMQLYADIELGREFGRIAFNAGSLTNSIVMQASDWQSIAKPIQFSISSSST